MVPGTAQALAIVGIAIAPGYLAVSTWARKRTWKGQAGDLRTLLQSVLWSAVIQLALLPVTLAWIYPVRESIEDHAGRVAVWLGLVVFVLPVFGGLGASWLADRFARANPDASSGLWNWFGRSRLAPSPPTIWDWLLSATPPYGQFLVLEFKDGSRAAGVFAGGSMAITSPEPHGLYLTSEWIVDDEGNPLEEKHDTRGILIPDLGEVRSIHLLGEHEDGED